MSSTEIWDKLHWFNFPDLVTRDVSNDSYFVHRLLPDIQNNNGDPFYVYMHNTRINKLDTINHSPEVVEYLNATGITFYLNEPLCMYETESKIKYNMVFYAEFTGHENSKDLRSEELDTILDYANRNNLSNITVKTCDYNVEKHLVYYTNRMALQYDDSFVRNVPVLTTTDVSYPAEFSKKIINLNWRWTPHRNILANFLINKDHHVSYYFNGDTSLVSARAPWFVPDKLDKGHVHRLMEGNQHIVTRAPFNVDLQITEAISAHEHYPKGSLIIDDLVNRDKVQLIEEKYRDVFCDIVTESRFAQPTGNYSEKAQQAIFYKKPFILVAPPKTLQAMKSHGYLTFGDFWDESYDDCYDHQERLIKIFKLIELIESKSLSDLQVMYKQMLPIIEHNYHQLSKNLSSYVV